MQKNNASAPAAYGPVPAARQMEWHRRPLNGFLHFGLNTFTGREWGYGDESPRIFNPPDFDAPRIAAAAAATGLGGLILTCKHHDGFCLWPSRYTRHSVKYSPWRNGRGDLVRETAEACRRQGLRFGVYLSPWDRNHPDYGRPAYLEYYRNQLNELTSEYGELFEVWFDGANGGDGYYGGSRELRTIDRRSYYDWENTWQIVRRNQPAAVIFSDAGPDIRWVGNEKGIAGDPCWATLSTEALFPGFGGEDWVTDTEKDMVKAWGSDSEMLMHGYRRGNSWVPAECDVSIRPGWFYHREEDSLVRDPENLLDLYFKSVGRGASLLLNVPPDQSGNWHRLDLQSLQGFHALRRRLFGDDLARRNDARLSAENVRGGDPRFGPARMVDGHQDTYWSTDDCCKQPAAVLEFRQPVKFNTVRLREYLPLGQRVDEFRLDIDRHGDWREYASARGIGSCRLLRGPECRTTRVRLRVTESPVCPAISELGLFMG